LGDSSVIQLVPGPNELPQEKWDMIKDHPTVKERMATKIVDPKRGQVLMLEVVIETKAVAETVQHEAGVSQEEPASSLSALSLREAKELVGETFNTVLLRQWQDEETRKGVLNAIEKQLYEIEKERKESEKESDELEVESFEE